MKKIFAYISIALLGIISVVSCGPSRFILEVEARQDSESEWKREQYSLYYFESDEWYTALEKAEALQWKSAMDIWMGQLESSNVLKRACAAYNPPSTISWNQLSNRHPEHYKLALLRNP